MAYICFSLPFLANQNDHPATQCQRNYGERSDGEEEGDDTSGLRRQHSVSLLHLRPGPRRFSNPKLKSSSRRRPGRITAPNAHPTESKGTTSSHGHGDSLQTHHQQVPGKGSSGLGGHLPHQGHGGCQAALWGRPCLRSQQPDPGSPRSRCSARNQLCAASGGTFPGMRQQRRCVGK